MIKIEIPSDEIIEKTSAKGNKYFQQLAYAYTVDENGKPYPFPERTYIYCPTDDSGTPRIYKKGPYKLMPQSLRVGGFDRLEVGNLVLAPL
ncbi:hypothetical protein BOW31_12740 [Solemya velum gill symbiont]|uniref:single-stranded DNA-binding protein n=1 Tax=Solemya velum gill symbiont TaxID=2340 RepID=UPI0009973545|nr:single-stranded DNA-binding protein [Solemya velum gill symbiont]OOZ21375.1 hypothetical protein BOW31_12740 [Solemya velum gill symbiont]